MMYCAFKGPRVETPDLRLSIFYHVAVASPIDRTPLKSVDDLENSQNSAARESILKGSSTQVPNFLRTR